MSCRVAVIGAGISGLAVARQLRLSGVETQVFEKSRGLGGRMATRRAGGGGFDHGAQYFTAKAPAFRHMTDACRAAGVAAPWFDDALVGTPTMTAPAQHMAEGVDVILGTEVVGLTRGSSGWVLRTSADPTLVASRPPFDAVVLAVPAPQAARLAASAGITIGALERVRMAPCWALMASFDRSWRPIETCVRPDHPAVAWVADTSSKPGRSAAEAHMVVHATPKWSQAHLERSADQVRDMLLEALQEVIGLLPAPVHATAHRWRYARVDQPVGAPFIWDDALHLGACGDWCLGPRIECAFESGDSIGRTLATVVGVQHDH